MHGLSELAISKLFPVGTVVFGFRFGFSPARVGGSFSFGVHYGDGGSYHHHGYGRQLGFYWPLWCYF